MDHPTIQRDFTPGFHTDTARKLAGEQSAGRMSWADYLSRTVPVMVGLQSQGKHKAVECTPVVVAISESLGVLTHDLIEIVTSQSDNSNLVQQGKTILTVKWYGCGSRPFDGHDTLLLSNMNLAPTLCLLKQRQRADMILLESGDSEFPTGQGAPGGHQKGSKSEKKRPEGRNTVRGESVGDWKWDQRRGSLADVMMEGTTPPSVDD